MKIEKCPECYGNGSVLKSKYVLPVIHIELGTVRVECNRCSGSGSIGIEEFIDLQKTARQETVKEAVEALNKMLRYSEKFGLTTDIFLAEVQASVLPPEAKTKWAVDIKIHSGVIRQMMTELRPCPDGYETCGCRYGIEVSWHGSTPYYELRGL
ncbi:MAG: hypothetical protein Q7T34_02210 [Candidatus Parcubacteria bacterium]|nr:hypothetical protein [Candidatus Parcubacteria bacterium]